MENLRELQENEITVLKSIFCNNIVDLRDEANKQNAYNNKEKGKQQQQQQNATKSDHDPIICITLFPQSSQSQHDRDIYVQIDLKIKFTPSYPNELPKISLQNEKGLSTDLIKQLHRQLVKKGNELIGNEMVYELCQMVQVFLYEHNKPPLKSFYEQRLESKVSKEAVQESANIEDKKKIEDELELLAEIENARDLRKKMLYQERKKEKEMEKRERLISTGSPSSRSSKNNSESEPKDSLDFVEQAQSTPQLVKANSVTKSNSFKPFTIEFNEPQPIQTMCIKIVDSFEENAMTIYRAVDVNTKQIYTVYEWKFLLERNRIFEKKKLDICQSEMNKLEEEFKRLNKLNHSLLIKYLAYKHHKVPNKNLFLVHICLDYFEGNTLEFFLSKKQAYLILESTLKSITSQLLEALNYLHSNQVSHRDLKPSCIHLDKDGLRLKLSDYSVVKKMNNLNETINNDAINTMQGNAKSDIHQLGLLVLSLRLGEMVREYHPQIPTDLPPDLKSFISLCFKPDKADCKYLLSHPFILRDANDDLVKNLAIKRNASTCIDNDEDGLKSFTDYPSQSRLNTEFEVIGVIGHGGFGEVLKVKNKLDSRFYAIKRIRVNPNSKHNKQITREIKLLSRLNHENVVRYYSTWIESYEEITSTSAQSKTGEKQKVSQSQETTEAPTSLVRFESMEANNQELSSSNSLSSSASSSSSSSRSSESNRGLWNRKESSKSNEKEFSYSLSDFSSSSNHSVVSSSSPRSTQSSEEKKNDPFKCKKKKKKTFFTLEKRTESDNDSVIFFENSREKASNNGTILDQNDPNQDAEQNVQKPNKVVKQESDRFTCEDSDTEIKNAKLKEPIQKHYIYIQMEYCGGKTLKSMIDKGLPLEKEEKIWCVFREILQGLNHIHEQGMIHRDLKPSNVLIDHFGHAKIGDFGLATTKLIIQKENHVTSNMLSSLPHVSSSNSVSAIPSNNNSNLNDALDSTSLSGAVGTALYVAPELLTPACKNKFIYTQKVDIYSLGIMLYEMFFAFPTNMERIHVLQNLRLKEILFDPKIDQQAYAKQIKLLKAMLNHDPTKRPSVKDLLMNDIIPRKADEIALEELLKYSFNNKQSANYKRIIKAIFDQKNTKIEDASYNANFKQPNSFRAMQIREHVYNKFLKIFQRYGGYQLNYPLLTPYDSLFDEYKKTYKLTDTSGLIVCLPYNHRMPFARWVARSECKNARRYCINKVFAEKVKNISYHPREHIEASFDIITSSNTDFLAELEILSLINEIVSSFPDLADQNMKIVINHSSLLTSIFYFCGINDEAIHKRIFTLLSEFSSEINNLQNYSKERRVDVFKAIIEEQNLNISSQSVEKLMRFLLKYGEVNDNLLSELRLLTKSESHFSKQARETINQLKLISNNYKIIGLKIPLYLSVSFTMPLIAHPAQYSGLIFQLLIQKKKIKDEYDILASGGRYDKLIAYFRNKQSIQQCAIGVSFDFEKFINVINQKSKLTCFRNELAICSIGESNGSLLNAHENGSSNKLMQLSKMSNQKSSVEMSGSSSLIVVEEIRNRLKLYRQMALLNRFVNVSTYITHERFTSVEEADEYCKKNSISSYAYLKDSSTAFSSTVFANDFKPLGFVSNVNENVTKDSISSANSDIKVVSNSNSNILTNSALNFSFVKLRSLIDKRVKLAEKKFNLHEFLVQTNNLINNMTSFNAINFNPLQNANPNIVHKSTSFGSTTSLNSVGSSSNSNQQNQSTYSDFLSSMMNSSTASISSVSLAQTTSSPSSSTLNLISQLNIIILIESASKQQQSSNASNKKKIESQIVSKVNHVLSLFSSRTRIELIAIDTADHVIQTLANGLHLEMDEQSLSGNWQQCLNSLNNAKIKKQLCSIRLYETIHDLRYSKRSKVFILYSLKNDTFKLLVIP